MQPPEDVKPWNLAEACRLFGVSLEVVVEPYLRAHPYRCVTTKAQTQAVEKLTQRLIAIGIPQDLARSLAIGGDHAGLIGLCEIAECSIAASICKPLIVDDDARRQLGEHEWHHRRRDRRNHNHRPGRRLQGRHLHRVQRR